MGNLNRSWPISTLIKTQVCSFLNCSVLRVSMLVISGARGIILRDFTQVSCFWNSDMIVSCDMFAKAYLGTYTPTC